MKFKIFLFNLMTVIIHLLSFSNITGELTTVSMGTTTQPSTIEVTTATECVKEKVVLGESNIDTNNPLAPLSTSDKDALQEKDDNKFVETNESIMVLLIDGLDEEVNGVTVSGDGIATITVKYNLPDNPEFITVQAPNVQPGEEIPLESRKYNVIRITVTKQSGSSSIRLDSVELSTCGELTTVSMGTTTQPSTIEVTTATECVKEKVVLGESNIDTNNPLAPLSTSDKDALQEKDDNKFVETNESIMVLLIDGLDEEVNGVTVSGDGIATITVKYNLPDNPEFITVQAPNVQPGEEIPLESRKYNVIRITVTKQSGSSSIRLDSVELSTCGELTTVSMGTTTQPSTIEVTTATECVKEKVVLGESNIDTNNPLAPLSTSDKDALQEKDDNKFVETNESIMVLLIDGLDEEVNGVTVSGDGIATITVKYNLPDNPEFITVQAPNVQPGEEIPLESRKYNVIRITVTKQSGSSSIRLDSVELSTCGELTTVSMGTTTQPSTIEVTTATECVKEKVVLGESNIDTNNPLAPLSTSDKDALQEKDDNKFVETNESIMVLLIDGLDEEVNGVTVSGDGIATITVKYNLPDNPEFITVQAPNVQPGEEIPLESRKYNVIRITVTKQSGSSSIRLDSVELSTCGELTTVSMGTTTQPSTIEVTTATECVKEKVVLGESNIDTNNPLAPLSTSDKDALQEKDDNKFVETNESIMVLLIDGLDEEVNGVTVSGDGIATITVKYNLPDNPEFITVQAPNVQPGEEIPLESRKYNVIRITVTKQSGSSSIRLDSVELSTCGELTTVSMGTTTQPSTIEVTTATECVKEKVVLGESNIDTNNPLAPLSTSDKDALQEKDDNKFVETNESIMVLLIDGLDEEVNGVTVSGDGIATITVKYNLPDNPEFITVQAPNVQPGEEIPLESRKYNVIRITVTKQSGSSSIRLDSVELSTCGELTTVSMGTTTQPSTIEVTTATECVKEKVVLGESNIDTNNPLAPLSTSDKDALQEKDDNKFVETNESIMVLLIDGLDEEVNGVTVSGDGIATITVKYNLPDNPEFITVQAPNVQPGEEIPLESRKYNVIRITVTKQSGSSSIRLDSVELSTCELIECPDLAEVNFATITNKTGINENDNITYACDSDNVLKSGDLTRQCMKDETWSGSPPVCGIPNPNGICTLPPELRNTEWIYEYTKPDNNQPVTTTLQFLNTILPKQSSMSVNALGTIMDAWTCISNLTISDTDSVVVFKSDTSHSAGPFSAQRWLYLCMKLTKVTDNLFYFYLLSDVDKTVFPNERVFNPKANSVPANTDPLCTTFCQHSTIPKRRTLRKKGTTDVMPNDARLCTPCESPCEEQFIVCPDLTPVNFATITNQTGTNYKDTITYTCNTGYELTSGSLTRQCMKDKIWSGGLSVCSKDIFY
ncbi:uncharacterized protein LOC143043007 [Mytilus galloprovincialis]|uniref:uncharacterized protein LOC143043007 n=1 Tax=Mytilus galloprovincialis TaxID=29158 RepID=UPI003F7B6861